MPVTKDGSIYINTTEFSQGQANTPFAGIGNARNVDMLNVPGSARVAYRTQLLFTPSGLPTAIVRDVSGNTYVGTETGNLYKNGVLLQGGLNQVYDMKIYKNYLFVAHSTQISLYGPLTTAPVWLANWLGTLSGNPSLVSGYNHPLWAATDDKVYVGNGNNLGAISSFVAAASGVNPTASYNSAAVPIPDGKFIRSLTQLGINLVMGMQAGSGMYDYAYGIGDIYYWDKSSTAVHLPQIYQESGVNQMLQVGNQLYVHAGIYGNIYNTNSSNFTLLRQLPYNYVKTSSIFTYPNAIGKLGNEIVFGTCGGGDGTPSVHGVYTMTDKGISYLRNTISTGNYGQTNQIKIGAILTLNSGPYKYMLIGWQDGSTFGVDEIDSFAYPTGAILESQVYRVGTVTQKKSFGSFEYSIARPLTAQQSIVVKYRLNTSADWTTLGTFTSSNTASGSLSHSVNANIAPAENIQLRIELNQARLGSTFGDNIDLLEVRLLT